MTDLAALLAGAVLGYALRAELAAIGERIGWTIGRGICRALLGVDIGARPDG